MRDVVMTFCSFVQKVACVARATKIRDNILQLVKGGITAIQLDSHLRTDRLLMNAWKYCMFRNFGSFALKYLKYRNNFPNSVRFGVFTYPDPSLSSPLSLPAALVYAHWLAMAPHARQALFKRALGAARKVFMKVWFINLASFSW
jgi:hypothetical protein